MQGTRQWIKSGILEPVADFSQDSKDFGLQHESKLMREGGVRLTTGSLGTELRWIVSSPNTVSLFTAIEIIADRQAPYVLRFHASGWFEEFYQNPDDAIRRIEDIIARGDRHFTSRIFFEQRKPESEALPDALRESIDFGQVPEDYAVVCSMDETTQSFVVDHVGEKSAIGRVWGTYRASPPCQPLGSYGDTVAETYREVLKSDRPRYDHVLAALRLPDNAVHWVPYHRLIVPRWEGRDRPAVAIVSQIAKVDIRVL